MSEVYNPLDKINLGKSVADALLKQPVHPLGDIPPFEGAGIYVIYYHGDFPAYAPIAAANAENSNWPIYIGKAIPSGGRKGASISASKRGTSLYKRLREHRQSIHAVEDNSGDLRVAHFTVRYLTVDDIWIPLGESLLIVGFKPVWNTVLDGFGNHTPGKGRFEGVLPLWDFIHSGRKWGPNCVPRSESRDEIEVRVKGYLAAHSFNDGGAQEFPTL